MGRFGIGEMFGCGKLLDFAWVCVEFGLILGLWL